jgi:hypothetical protein
MVTEMRAVVAWIGRALDAILSGQPAPSPTSSRASEAEANDRRLRLRLKMLEKRGKGGYR